MKIGTNKLTFILAEGICNPLMNYETEGIKALGQKATALDSRGVIQFMSRAGYFLMAQGGYVHRFDPVPSSLNFGAKVGLAKADYYIELWFDHQNGEDGNNYREQVNVMGALTDPSFRTFTVSYSKIGASYYKPLSERKGISFGAAYVLYGQNIGKSISVSFAYVYKLNYKKKAS